MEKSETHSKIVQTASILVVLVLFYVALWVLRREIHASHLQDVIGISNKFRAQQFLLAFLLQWVSYFALTFYDV